MGSMKDLLGDTPLPYPESPGFKGEAPSHEAATKMQPVARTLRELVYREIAGSNGKTADEAATALGKSILSVRPRVAELHQMDWIKPAGERRTNESGMSATVWVSSRLEHNR